MKFKNFYLSIKKNIDILFLIKFIAVGILAGTVTYLSKNISHFEILTQDKEYGIWYGFPLAYFIEGTKIEKPEGILIGNWNRYEKWFYPQLIFDFLIWFIFIGAILWLAELGLKRLFKIKW